MTDIIFDPKPSATLISVGDPYPEALPAGDGAAVRLLDGQGMWITVQMDTPTSQEVDAYRHGNITFGIFQHPAKFPWGLLLFAVATSGGRTVQQEVPMGIEGEALLRPQAVTEWCEGRANALSVILVDSKTRRTASIRQIGLTPQITERLGSMWKTQLQRGCSMEQYYRDLQAMQMQFSTQQLWDRAEKLWLKKK